MYVVQNDLSLISSGTVIAFHYNNFVCVYCRAQCWMTQSGKLCASWRTLTSGT